MRRVFIGAGGTLGSAQIYYWLLQTLLGSGAPRCFTFIKSCDLYSPAEAPNASLLNDDAEVGESDSIFVVILMNAAPPRSAT